MSEQDKPVSGQEDANLAAETRPIPSQAEGDRETVEEDLKQKSNQTNESAKQKGAGKS
jgi:hypothetical protein